MFTGAAIGEYHYLFTTPDDQIRGTGQLESALIGGVGGVSIERGIFKVNK